MRRDETFVGCRSLVLEHLFNLGPLQYMQVDKTAHTLVLAESSELLVEKNF